MENKGERERNTGRMGVVAWNHTDTQTHRHTQRHTETHRDTHTHTQTGTQTHRHTDTQTHRHTDTQTHRQALARSLAFERTGANVGGNVPVRPRRLDVGYGAAQHSHIPRVGHELVEGGRNVPAVKQVMAEGEGEGWEQMKFKWHVFATKHTNRHRHRHAHTHTEAWTHTDACTQVHTYRTCAEQRPSNVCTRVDDTETRPAKQQQQNGL